MKQSSFSRRREKIRDTIAKEKAQPSEKQATGKEEVAAEELVALVKDIIAETLSGKEIYKKYADLSRKYGTLNGWPPYKAVREIARICSIQRQCDQLVQDRNTNRISDDEYSEKIREL